MTEPESEFADLRGDRPHRNTEPEQEPAQKRKGFHDDWRAFLGVLLALVILAGLAGFVYAIVQARS